jgi:hypothetical protein
MTRRFLLHLTDGRTFPGVEFPSGHAALNHPEADMASAFTIATTVDHLTDGLHPRHPLHGARVEWTDPEQPPTTSTPA